MKNLKLFLFATLAMFVAITGVNAVSTPQKTSFKLSELTTEQRTITNNGDKSVYKLTLSSAMDTLEIDIDNVVINLNTSTSKVSKIIVAAENVSLTDGETVLSNVPAKIEVSETGLLVLDGKAALMNTDIINKGKLEITGGSFKSVTNEDGGILVVSSSLSGLIVNGGSAIIDEGGILYSSTVNGGELVIGQGATASDNAVTVKGGHALSYAAGLGGGLSAANDSMVALLAKDTDGNPVDLVVPVDEIVFDVKIVDLEGNEVSGEVKAGERYIVTPVKYWNGVEVTSEGAGSASLVTYIPDTMPVTSIKTADETILVPYTGSDKQDNEFIAVADGIAKFEITVAVPTINTFLPGDDVKTITGTADSAHSTVAVEPTEPEKDPGESGGSAVTPGESTDNPTTDETKTPNTVDSIPTYLAAGAVSIMGLALLGFSIKKRMED